MEKFTRQRNQRANLPSRLEQAARSALAGAAILGAASAAEAPASAAPLQPTHEQHESFGADQEAKAFLAQIASMEFDTDDAAGTRDARIKIEEMLGIFALSLETRTSYFSGNGSRSITGSISPQTRERARQYLLPKVLIPNSSPSNSAVETLKNILAGPSAVSPERRKRLGDW